MATDQQNLSSEQKELVAVGASVGAGCHPCFSHHLKAAAQAGLDSDELLAAVDGAERVASEATTLVADDAREQLGSTVTTAALTPLDEALAAFGAALGANDAAAIDLQLRSALDFGASRSQLQQAIETAKTVQEHAGRIHVRNAERLLESIAAASTATETDAKSGNGCGCAVEQTEATPVAAPAPTAAQESPKDDAGADRASDRAAGFKPSMAECFGSVGNAEGAGLAAMTAHCREMFGGLFGESAAPAKTEESPASTAAKGCFGKKEG